MSKRTDLVHPCLAPIKGGPNWLMAFGIALFAPTLLLLLAVILGGERDPHGGMYALVLVVPLLVIAVCSTGIGLAWHRLKRRRGRKP